MSGYEVEHNIKADAQPESTSRRPDLSTFFSTLREVDNQEDIPQQNAHTLPLPENVAAVFRLLAEAIQAMTGEASGGTDLQQSMIDQLLRNAHDPPREVSGVPETFFDELDRVPKAKLKQDEDCPICGQPFLEDPYPLVVRLPCHDDHKFDLECIRPWLKINTTCPLDRKELVKRKAPPPPDSEDEDDYNGFYG